MNQQRAFFKMLRQLLVPTFFLVALIARAEPVQPKTLISTNSVSTNYHSVFIIPASSKEGRDPFFPTSNRPYQTAVVPTAATMELNLNSLVLQGISGTPPHQLVIINKRTFAVGDFSEVSTSQGRFHVHCLEINAKSCVIEVNGQRHELRYEEKP
jgi:hypothetical protein